MGLHGPLVFCIFCISCGPIILLIKRHRNNRLVRFKLHLEPESLRAQAWVDRKVLLLRWVFYFDYKKSTSKQTNTDSHNKATWNPNSYVEPWFEIFSSSYFWFGTVLLEPLPWNRLLGTWNLSFLAYNLLSFNWHSPLIGTSTLIGTLSWNRSSGPFLSGSFTEISISNPWAHRF